MAYQSNKFLQDIAQLQAQYKNLVAEKGKITKKMLCELVTPFRDRYRFSDSEALMYARGEVDFETIISKNESFNQTRWELYESEFLLCRNCGEEYWTGCETGKEAVTKLIDGDYPNYCPKCGCRTNGFLLSKGYKKIEDAIKRQRWGIISIHTLK